MVKSCSILTRSPWMTRLPIELMQRGETTAVFQLESRGMKELIRKLGPDRFEDIVALVALFRPGPLQSGMVDDFINRKRVVPRSATPMPNTSMTASSRPWSPPTALFSIRSR